MRSGDSLGLPLLLLYLRFVLAARSGPKNVSRPVGRIAKLIAVFPDSNIRRSLQRKSPFCLNSNRRAKLIAVFARFLIAGDS